MPSTLQLDQYLEVTSTTNRWRRAFAARIDMTLKRGRLTSAWVARRLGVSEGQVGFWRDGVIVPTAEQCRRLSALLKVDLDWLCAIDASSLAPQTNT